MTEKEKDLLNALTKKMGELYVSFRKRYVMSILNGSMFVPKDKNGVACVLTDHVLFNHLRQRYAVAVFAGPCASKFICFDVDDGAAETVHAIIDCLIALGFPQDCIYVSFSGGKGYHVEMFFNQLVYTNRLYALYSMVISQAHLDPRKVEFRPLSGNAIKLPLSIHGKTGKVCWFVDQKTQEPIEKAEYLLDIEQLPANILTELIPEDILCPKVQNHTQCNPLSSKKGEWSTDPLTEIGTRHNQMRSIAVYLRTHGHDREACRKAMLEWYEEQDPALIRSDRETVLCDMEEMLDWVFSGRFELRTSGLRKKVQLSSADAQMIASAACRSQKRILFLLTMLCRSGLSAISYVEIAQLIGTSRNAVANSILKLLVSGKIQRRIGGHYLTSDGHYGTERNQYTVPFCKQKHGERTAEFSLGEVKENFDASYIRCIELLTDQEKRQYFSSKELAEMKGVAEEALIRIDLEGRSHIFHSNVYGMLVAYEYNGVRYYPLLDVVKCLKVNQPRTIVQRCKEKKLFAIPAGRQIAGKGFVDAACLRGILEKSKSMEKQLLMDWLLNEEEWK